MKDLGIVVVTGHFSLESGGVGTHIRLLIRQLEQKGVPHGVARGKSRMDAAVNRLIRSASKRYGIDISTLSDVFHNVGGLYRSIRQVLSGRSEERIVLHAHDRPSMLAAALAKGTDPRVCGIVQTAHAPFAQQYEGVQAGPLLMPMLRAIDRGGMDLCDHFIAVDTLQEELIRRWVPTATITEIPNAVDLEMLADVEKSPATNEFGEPYLIVARHLYEKCGVHVAVDAFARADCSKTHLLVLMGDGDQREALEASAQRLNIADRVKFIGRQPHSKALPIIRNATLSLVPSIPVGDYIEATSITMLESLGLGVPLIASNIGGLKQVLSGTGAGILVEPNDAESLAKEMDGLLNDDRKRNDLSKKGRALVATSYSTESWFSRIMDVYRSVAEAAG